MSYTEVESYRDSEKKQPRQGRRYLGKKDPDTGEVITPRKSKQLPRLSRDFGHVYLLKHIRYLDQKRMTSSILV